jgi:hypothetical protein
VKPPDPGGFSVSDAVTCPFLPELNVPVALTGPLIVVLFEALGLAPPRLTHTYPARTHKGVGVRNHALGGLQPNTLATIAALCFRPVGTLPFETSEPLASRCSRKK